MAQRVTYEPIPGTRFDQYIFKLRLVLGYLNTPGGTKFKGFRDFLRKQNLWDKDKSEVLFGVLDISWDKTTVKVGKTAKRLNSAHSDTDFQNVLFERLKEVNILLVKYVLEALDVTQGGRLHSVHELYRMITSYVYPGTYITLTAFQAWVEWLAASGYIKLVGIRWALSDRGQKIVSELRSMDVDEIMEDMEDEAPEGGADEGGAADDDEEDNAPAPAPVAAPRPVAAPAPNVAVSKFAKPALPQPVVKASKAAASDDIDDDEDLFADLPPEPDAPDEDAVRAASMRLGLDDDDDDEDGEAPPPKPMAAKYTPPASLAARPKTDAKAAAPTRSMANAPRPVGAGPAVATTMAAVAPGHAGLHAPLAVMGYQVVPVSALGAAGEAELVDRVIGFWQALGDWPTFAADKLGVVHQPGAGDLALLIELGVLAVLIEGLPPQPQVFAFVRRMRETTFFASLGHGEGLEEGLDALERLGSEPWARHLFERLVHARFIARRVGMKIDLLYQMRAAASGREVVQLVREHLTGPNWVEAPFWVARELVRLGVLKDEKHRSAVAVPTKKLVENAARVGIAKVTELRDVESLVALSEAVSALFGSAEAGYGEALANLDRGLGLSL